jgi:hypothetical protein
MELNYLYCDAQSLSKVEILVSFIFESNVLGSMRFVVCAELLTMTLLATCANSYTLELSDIFQTIKVHNETLGNLDLSFLSRSLSCRCL